MSSTPDYIRWYPGAIALAGSLLSAQRQPQERAKDIVQQAVALLIERGEHLGAHRRAWFFTVVRNACIDEIREQRKYVMAEETVITEMTEAGPADHHLALERQQQIKHALQSLKFEQREILLLRDVNDLSYADISQVLAINVGTVMSRLHRARLALRLALQSRGDSQVTCRTEAVSASAVSAQERSSATQSNSVPKEAL